MRSVKYESAQMYQDMVGLPAEAIGIYTIVVILASSRGGMVDRHDEKLLSAIGSSRGRKCHGRTIKAAIETLILKGLLVETGSQLAVPGLMAGGHIKAFDGRRVVPIPAPNPSESRVKNGGAHEIRAKAVRKLSENKAVFSKINGLAAELRSQTTAQVPRARVSEISESPPSSTIEANHHQSLTESVAAREAEQPKPASVATAAEDCSARQEEGGGFGQRAFEAMGFAHRPSKREAKKLAKWSGRYGVAWSLRALEMIKRRSGETAINDIQYFDIALAKEWARVGAVDAKGPRLPLMQKIEGGGDLRALRVSNYDPKFWPADWGERPTEQEVQEARAQRQQQAGRR